MIDITFASDNSSRFRQNLIIDDKIADEKVQYDINREAAKISKLLSGKIDK